MAYCATVDLIYMLTEPSAMNARAYEISRSLTLGALRGEDAVLHQANHVSHVVFIYKRENFDRARKQFGDALGITDWHGPKELEFFGVLHTQSLSAGIEILSPIREGTMFDQYLKTKGEGFFVLVYGVNDVRKAQAQAQARGIQPELDEKGNPVYFDIMQTFNGGPPYEDWPVKMKHYKEMPLMPICGVNLYLGQIEPVKSD
jgi:hypothetical protein